MCSRRARSTTRWDLVQRRWGSMEDDFLTVHPARFAGVTSLTQIGHCGSAALVCPEKSGQDRPVNDSVVPSSCHSAVSPSGHPGRFHPDRVPRDAIPRLAPGAALIVVLLLSVGLWSLIWLAISDLAAIRPW